jgi:hypothetical protein
MADQRSVMKEYRHLDQKRVAQGLTEEEEARYTRLRDLIGPEMGAGGLGAGEAMPRRREPLKAGFDVNAAAAHLRDSLLPAGLRNRPPPTPAPMPAAPAEPVPEALSAVDALASVYAAQPFEPLDFGQSPEQDAFFDPAELAMETAPAASYEPNAPSGDASADYDPNAQAGWDPNQPWDPNAAAAQLGAEPYDPNAQPYDPNAQPYDPNAQPYDPSAQPYDPNAAYDPNGQSFDAGAGQDPAQAAWDPDQPWDPNALAADAAAESYDPNAQPYDAGASDDQPAQAGWDPNQPLDADAFPADPAAQPYDQAAAYSPNAASYEIRTRGEAALPHWGPLGGDAALDQSGPDAEAASPADGDQAWDAAGSSEPLPADASLPDAPWSAPELTLDDAGVPVDDAAPSPGDTGILPPADWTAELSPPVAAQAPPGEYDAAAGFSDATYAADELADDADTGAAQLLPGESGAFEPETALEDGFQLESGGSFGAGADAATPEWPGGAAAQRWDAAGPPETPPGDRSEYEIAPVPEGETLGEPPAEEGAFIDAAGDAAELPTEIAPAPLAAPAAAETGATLDFDVDAEEIPTIEGADILEELPEEIPAHPPGSLDFEPIVPAAGASETEPVEQVSLPPAAADSLVVAGSHRVVVHTVEGLVKRGVLEDPDLASQALALDAQAGQAPEEIETDKVKAIFFMLAPGEKPPAPEGKRVRVSFRDGRQVAGFCPDYDETGVGFFMIPGDSRTNTGRIWVYRSAVRDVSVS